MNGLDWTLLALYMASMVVLSLFLGRGQEDADDYYVGGRNLPWWGVGISTMATQTSAISFISIPGFVALKPGGGLTWLSYELAVPLAMVFIMVFLLPLFRKLEIVSVYEYLERRFGGPTRSLLAAVFLLSRGLGTGVGLYAAAIVLSVVLELPLWVVIIGLGVVTLIYDTIGGMKAVVYSDVIQMGILVVGIGLSIVYALDLVGGWSAALDTIDAARLVALDTSVHGLGDLDPNAARKAFPMWGFLVGGFFLYASYYGCDQSQAQRELSTPSLAHTKYSLIFNGFARLPLTLAYVVLGIAVGGVFAKHPEAMKLLHKGQPDYMVPVFVLKYLPHGIKALIFSALLAAAMSSLDSSINSLSASTMQDFIERFARPKNARKQLLMSKGSTVAWGMLVIVFAFLLGGQDTVVERINKIGSAFYGPILATFVAGVALRRVGQAAVIAGIIAGVAVNVVLWIGAGDAVFWMWWNAAGCVVSLAVALLISLVAPARDVDEATLVFNNPEWKREGRWLPAYGLLVGFFALMLWALGRMPSLLDKR
ncbi:MAG: sodium:solute symporter [Myxococcales bacterium]|nr:sodium:solute symporter [Myxococcales bacterium]